MSQRQLKACSKLAGAPLRTNPPSTHLLLAAAQTHPSIDPLTGLDDPWGQGKVLPPAVLLGGAPLKDGAKISL